MLITIVTITLNNFEELLRTVESVQDLDDCENIIINGGQCPRTLEFLQGYSGKSISEPDQGIADAFNKGIQHSNGDAIIMLNSGDCLIDQNYPSRASQILNQYPDIDFVHADLIFEDKLIGPYVMRPLRTMNSLYPSIGRGMPYRHQSMVVRKKTYDLVGLFNLEYICCDYDWVCRWELGIKKSKRKAYYLQGNPVIIMDGGGISSRNESKVILEAFQIILKHSATLGSLKKIITFSALFKRIFLYSCRFILIRMGYVHILAKIKRIKYFKHVKNP